MLLRLCVQSRGNCPEERIEDQNNDLEQQHTTARHKFTGDDPWNSVKT
jgi:hypothetical protein